MASHDSSRPEAPDAATQPAMGKQSKKKKQPQKKQSGEKPPGGPGPSVGTASSDSITKKKKLKRVRVSGDLEKLKKKMWQTISAAEEILLDPDSDSATRLKAIHALVQAGAAYTRLVESTEQAERIAALEAESGA